MKSMNFFAIAFLFTAPAAMAKINLSLAVMRNDSVNTAANIQLVVDQRELCYQDETAYIEAELIEENADTITLQFTVATKNETGAYMVRGLPKLLLPIDAETKTGTSSMRCDGPSESFNLVVSAYKIEEAVAPLPSIE